MSSALPANRSLQTNHLGINFFKLSSRKFRFSGTIALELCEMSIFWELYVHEIFRARL